MNDLRNKIINDIEQYESESDENILPDDEYYTNEKVLGVSKYIINLGIDTKDAELAGYGVFLKRTVSITIEKENREALLKTADK
ncbi:MAG: hypothetical protein QNL62_06530 [Gammaproteobacteria bacterium]|nr:hypothetical protein [Gammaproteobacteria bacterium]